MLQLTRFISLFLLLLNSIACKQIEEQKTNIDEAHVERPQRDAYKEIYRPQFHFSPKEKWMNDPNGMVFYKGVYHLFYQYYPEDVVWGPMHWGHATSKDLIKWEHKGIKLYPDQLGYIFSGSAVVDHNNTSGFGTKESPPLVAIFTYHDAIAEKDGKDNYQTQGIAYSLDNGETWTKYKNNPVIDNPGLKDFRDPKVRWHQPSKKWIMCLAVADHISFYASKDLIHWNKLSDFGSDIGAHGGVWECPDLFPMALNGTDDVKWILLVSINPGGPNGGSATQYFVGSFDGFQFVPDDTQTRWVDHGADNYAGVTYSNVSDDKRIFLGWMSNWDYAQETPTSPWRSAMTIPRELSLISLDSKYYIKSVPVKSFEKLRVKINDKKSTYNKERYKISDQAEILFKTQLNKVFTVKLLNGTGEHVVLHFDPDNEVLSFDRRKSGRVDFSKKFGNKIHTLPVEASDSLSEIRIIIDKSSIEIFIQDGRYVMTEQVFPKMPYNEMTITSPENITINELNIYHINSIWKHE